MKVTIYGQQTVYYAYEADYGELKAMDEAGKLPSPAMLRKHGNLGVYSEWITQEMRESFADLACEVDSSEMQWTEIQVAEE